MLSAGIRSDLWPSPLALYIVRRFGVNRHQSGDFEVKKWVYAFLCLSMSACAWVTLTPAGEKVRVLDSNEVVTCKELGNTTVSLLAKVAGINRNEEEVKKELAVLARNAAADMGGDTVVAKSEVKGGERSFTVYKCVGVTKK
jgi:hypothetical protein